MFTFFVFSTGWNIAQSKILQGADFGCPLVECLPRDGAHWHQKDAKVSERGKGIVLHGRASERCSHETESKDKPGHTCGAIYIFYPVLYELLWDTLYTVLIYTLKKGVPVPPSLLRRLTRLSPSPTHP